MTETSARIDNIKNQPIVVQLDAAQEEEAFGVANARLEKYPENNPKFQVNGAFAEIAVSHWLRTQGFPVEKVFSEQDHLFDRFDIRIGNFVIEVKSCSQDGPEAENWRFPSKQDNNLDHVHGVIWCRVEEEGQSPGKGEWNPPMKVFIHGWSTPDDIRKSPIETNDNNVRNYIVYQDLRTIESLLVALQQSQQR